jgi:sugar/nucleoside kinase (ribokinase family)
MAFGGAAFHFAVAAATLGVPVRLVSRAQPARWSRVFAQLERASVDARWVVAMPKDIVFEILYRDSLAFDHDAFHIAFPSAMPVLIDAVREAVAGERSLVHITALQPEELPSVVKAVRSSGCEFSIQTHTSQLRAGPEAFLDAARRARTVFVSMAELEMLFGHRDVKAVQDAVGEIGTRWFVTDEETIRIVDAREVSEVRMPGVPPVDPTGAGDGFAGAFTAGQLLTGDVRAAVRLAALYTLTLVTDVSSNAVLRLLDVDANVPSVEGAGRGGV